DMHESINAIDPGNEIEWAHPRNPMCDPALVAHAQAMIAAMKSRADSENWDNGEYRFDPEEEERVLHNTATLRNGVGVLVETNFADDSEPGQALRLEIQEAMIEEILAYVVDTADDLISEADAAASRATAAGAGQDPFDLRTTTLDPAPLGYRLTGVIPSAYLA